MTTVLSSVTPEQKLEILAEAVVSKRSNKYWKRALSLEDIPETVGHYALYDGIECRGGGVDWNMRRAMRESLWFGRCAFPIMLFLPDADGSAALWLDGKIKCERCHGEIHEIGLHDTDDDDEDAA